MWLVLCFICFFRLSLTAGRDEVLLHHRLRPDDLTSAEIAIVQYDTRPLGEEYWGVAARWNFAYARRHGHPYYYLSSKMSDECVHSGVKLSLVWCKVKAMIAVSEMYPKVKSFIYLDSDAIVTTNYSMAAIVSFMKYQLEWDIDAQPIAFNQDGPNLGCRGALSFGYPTCFNTGTLFWINNDISLRILRVWWDFAAKPYSASKYQRRWKVKWPWEQGPIHDVYVDNEKNIMRLSFPNLTMLPWPTLHPRKQYPTGEVSPWCFSHWPGANCFITHFAASMKQKNKIIEWHSVSSRHFPPVMYIDT